MIDYMINCLAAWLSQGSHKLAHQVVIIQALYQCTCRYKAYFFSLVFTYQGLLLVFGIFLAWKTSNVTIPTLNDSKYIGMSFYNVFVLSIIGAVVSLTLEWSEYYDTSYAILSMCLIMSTSLTILLMFAPKVRILCLETYHLHMWL